MSHIYFLFNWWFKAFSRYLFGLSSNVKSKLELNYGFSFPTLCNSKMFWWQWKVPWHTLLLLWILSFIQLANFSISCFLAYLPLNEIRVIVIRVGGLDGWGEKWEKEVRNGHFSCWGSKLILLTNWLLHQIKIKKNDNQADILL